MPSPRAIGGGDEDGIGEAGFGVHGEHHSGGGRVGAHHPLHTSREGNRSVVEVVMYAVGNGSIVMQGGEHLTNRSQDLLDAADVEECLLLSGEGGVRQILGCGARPDGEGQLDEVTYYYRERNIAAVVFTVDASTVTGHPSLSSDEIAEGAGKNADVLIPSARWTVAWQGRGKRRRAARHRVRSPWVQLPPQ